MSGIKPVVKCEDYFKALFPSAKCLLTISVGQEVHEGEKFEKTIEIVNNTFRSCTILIDDTLQRHTMALNTNDKTAADFYDASIAAGQSWLKRNRLYYEKLTIPYHIIHWNDFLFHKKFPAQQDTIKEFMQKNSTYHDCFESTIDEFLTRLGNRYQMPLLFSNERARLLCMDYLLEETTAMCLWPELNCQFEVYPSKRNAAMAATHQLFVLPEYPNLLHPVAIKFKNRKQLTPQAFMVEKSINKESIECVTYD